MSDDFDLPPPPDEYSNLPPMNSKPTATATASHGVPQQQQQLADWQREIAGKFRHHPTTTTTTTLSAMDNQDLPPPPSGFHDDLPAQPTHSRAQPFRGGGGGGLAGSAGGGGGGGGGGMSSWSRDDVVRWLKALNMPEHCAAFSAASITGQRLIQLTDDDLYALGVKQFGQRRMIRRAIESCGDDA